jgi:hypothetical protein
VRKYFFAGVLGAVLLVEKSHKAFCKACKYMYFLFKPFKKQLLCITIVHAALFLYLWQILPIKKKAALQG